MKPLATTGNKKRDAGTKRKTSWETKRKTSWETKRKTSWETRGDKATREVGHTIQQSESRRGKMGDKTLRKADTLSSKGKQEDAEWERKEEKGRKDRREGGHTVQQRKARRGTMGDRHNG